MIKRLTVPLLLSAVTSITAEAQITGLDAAYSLLADRDTANQSGFFVYQEADSGFNHGFPSGKFGAISKIDIDSACVDDPATANGCSTDALRLDRTRGNVLRVSFDPLTLDEFAGLNIEEPENFGSLGTGRGYSLTGATNVVFDIRSPGGITVQFGVGGCVTNFIPIQPSASYTTMSIPLGSPTCLPALSDVHILFAVQTNAQHAPGGGTVLLDNIRFEPTPTSQQSALSFPLSTQTFGVVPLQTPSSGRVPIPPDQLLRNVTTTYESAIVLMSLLNRGTVDDLRQAHTIADALDYALHHDSHGDPLPVAANGAMGLHNANESGDIALLNDQLPSEAGEAGDVRLAGFSASQAGCASAGFCLVLDGATGGNNAFAILALVAAYQEFNDTRYLDDARSIADWIAGKLTDTSGSGYGGYFLGYPDAGVVPKPLQTDKSVENNADIFAAFGALAQVERQLGNSLAANDWTTRANVAGDFVMAMFDSVTGCFSSGTVPFGTAPGPGVAPTGARQGNDVINIFQFLDANTFTTLAMARAPRYRNQLDWRRPVQCGVDHFAQTITVGAQTFRGFNIVAAPSSGPNGIAWEFTGQMVETMRFVDNLYNQTTYEGLANAYLSEIWHAQLAAPFGDGRGLVASTMQEGDTLAPIEQCLSTPFQCIPERVALAATVWAIFADQMSNPVLVVTHKERDYDGNGTGDLLWRHGPTGQTAEWLMNGLSPSSSVIISVDSNWTITHTGDLNGDGKTDLIWRNTLTGQTAGWLMNGLSAPSAAILYSDPNWAVINTGDFNGDGKADLVWRNTSTGQTAIWLMNGLSATSSALIYGDPNWVVTHVGDFDGDGKADLLWRNTATGQTAIWLMNGLVRTSSAVIYSDPNWVVTQIGDFDGDGKTDLLWRNTVTGQTAIWLMNGLSPTSSAIIYSDPNWMVTQTGDFDGDGKADLVWRNTATGQTAIWLMNGLTLTSSAVIYSDPTWAVSYVSDISGDGKSDLVWRNAVSGQTAAWLMNGLSLTSSAIIYSDPNWAVLVPEGGP